MQIKQTTTESMAHPSRGLSAHLKPAAQAKSDPRRGVALVSILAVFSLVMVLAYSFFAVIVDSVKHTNTRRDVTRMDSAAESAIALAVQSLWSGYVTSTGGTAGSLKSFRLYMGDLGIGAQGTDILQRVDLPKSMAAGSGIANCSVIGLQATSIDDGNSTEVSFTATVSTRRGAARGRTAIKRAVQQTFVVEGAQWTGLDFALLANNVNCIMCHAEIGSTDLYYNNDGQAASIDRVRVGTLERLALRSNADSVLAGTLYVRGAATDKQGATITNWPSQTLKGMAFDSNGKLLLDGFGDTSLTDLTPADPSTPAPLENLYLDYSLDKSTMADGYLPESFPPPFPDDGGYDSFSGGPLPGAAGNRVVDRVEFEAVASGSSGSLSGGTIHVNNDVDTIGTLNELNSALSTGNTPSLTNSTTGNVVLVGTELNPILLDGDVAIDGDVVIKGVVKGKGSLFVSGNIYVPTDLVYADGLDVNGNRTFGVGNDGNENSLAMAAGGSVIVGDLWYSKNSKGGPSPVTGAEDGVANFVISEMGLFNRTEWSKTQALLPGPNDVFNDPQTWTAVNPSYEKGYLPRYYAFNEGGTIPFFLESNGKNSMSFDSSSNSWVGKEHGGWTSMAAYPNNPKDPLLFDPSGNPIAVVQYLTVEGGWMSDAMLEKLMFDSLATRPTGTPMEVDALLYSNNSIYGMIGASSTAEGQMILNGALVAPDIGLLVAGKGKIKKSKSKKNKSKGKKGKKSKGTVASTSASASVPIVGLRLNYDQRLRNGLNLKNDGQVSLRPKLWSSAAAVH